MPPQILGIPAEFRVRICKLALQGTTYAVDIWGQYGEHDYFLEDYKITSNSPEAQRTTSLLLVCRQLHAEVSPFFHDFMRFHSRSNPCGYLVEVHESTFLHCIDCTVFFRAPHHVQILSIPPELA